MVEDLIDKRDEKIWDKAVDAFTKQYKKEPKTDRDYSVVSDLFQKMGGRFNHDEKLLEMFCEDYKMKSCRERLERLSVCKESYGVLDGDQSDVLEGIVLSNKTKTAQQVLQIVKKDSFFKGVKDSDLLKYINDARKIYKIESLTAVDRLYESVFKEGISFEDWKKSATGKFLIKKGLSEDELKKQYRLVVDFNKDSKYLIPKESLSPLDKLYESVCKEAKWTDYKVIKKNFLGDVGDHIIIDWNAFDSPKWKNLTKGTSGSPVARDELKALKEI